MIVIGLTGSMAMGKSTAASMLKEMKGVKVLCADEIVADLYTNKDVIDLIKTTFPTSYDYKKGQLDKGKLLGELGNDHQKWDALEDILHPYVERAQQKFIKDQTSMGTQIVVLDIPLLFETGADKRVDYTICVSAPEEIQHQRIAERIRKNEITQEDALFRLERQMGDVEKKDLSDFVVQTGQGLAYTRQELSKIIKQLKEQHLRKGYEGNGISSHKL